MTTGLDFRFLCVFFQIKYYTASSDAIGNYTLVKRLCPALNLDGFI